jgi:hypothetical protein
VGGGRLACSGFYTHGRSGTAPGVRVVRAAGAAGRQFREHAHSLTDAVLGHPCDTSAMTWSR